MEVDSLHASDAHADSEGREERDREEDGPKDHGDGRALQVEKRPVIGRERRARAGLEGADVPS